MRSKYQSWKIKIELNVPINIKIKLAAFLWFSEVKKSAVGEILNILNISSILQQLPLGEQWKKLDLPPRYGRFIRKIFPELFLEYFHTMALVETMEIEFPTFFLNIFKIFLNYRRGPVFPVAFIHVHLITRWTGKFKIPQRLSVIHSFVIHSFIDLFVRSSIRSFTHSFIYHSFIHSFIHSFFHSFIHSLIHSRFSGVVETVWSLDHAGFVLQ